MLETPYTIRYGKNKATLETKKEEQKDRRKETEDRERNRGKPKETYPCTPPPELRGTAPERRVLGASGPSGPRFRFPVAAVAGAGAVRGGF